MVVCDSLLPRCSLRFIYNNFLKISTVITKGYTVCMGIVA